MEHSQNWVEITLVEPSTGAKKITTFKYPPMGLIALAGYLVTHCHNVYLSHDSNVKTDIVGISSMSVNINESFKIAKEIKAKNPKSFIILGGIHPTVMPEHALSEPAVDLVVIGEGEITMLEILNDNPFGEIDGIAYRQDGKVKINKRRKLIKNLDILPIPAYDLLDFTKYHSPYARRKPFMSMVRSRGCPFACTFCGNPKMFGRTFRVQSPQRTMDEIVHLVMYYNIKELSFKDTELTLDPRLGELCERLIYFNGGFIWSCNGRVSNVNKKLLDLMKKAGCYSITFGIESGDQGILDLMKKQITLEQAQEGVRLAKEAGLQVVNNFMIGNAFDTKETIEKTIDFAKKLNSDFAYFGFATPFPGTELREQALENNWILDESMDAIRYDDCMMNATNMTLEELKPYLKKAYKSFYFRPRFLLKKALRFSEYPNYAEGLKKIWFT